MTFGLKGKPDFSEQPRMLFLKFLRPRFRSNALQAHLHRGTSILHYDFHVRRLSDGGTDTVFNTVALCPNCHRQFHHGVEAPQLVALLYTQIDRPRSRNA
jgi:predicted restriction endonuclease